MLLWRYRIIVWGRHYSRAILTQCYQFWVYVIWTPKDLCASLWIENINSFWIQILQQISSIDLKDPQNCTISRASSANLTRAMRQDRKKGLPASLASQLYWQLIVTRKVLLPKIIFEKSLWNLNNGFRVNQK